MQLVGGHVFAQVGMGAVAAGAVIFLFSLLLLPFVWVAGFSGLGTVPRKERSGLKAFAVGLVLFVLLTVVWFAGIFLALEVDRRGMGFLSVAVLVSSLFVAFGLGCFMAGGVGGDQHAVHTFLRSWALTFMAITVLSVGASYLMGAGERATEEALSVVVGHVDTSVPRGSGGRYQAKESRQETCSWGDSRSLYYQVGPKEAEQFAVSLESDGWEVKREVDDDASWKDRTVFRVEAISPDRLSLASAMFDSDTVRISVQLRFNDHCPFELRGSSDGRVAVDEFPELEARHESE